MILSYLRGSEILIPKQARNPLFLAGSQALVHRAQRSEKERSAFYSYGTKPIAYVRILSFIQT